MEEYKPILDYPSYEVSNLGNVRNIKTGRILKSGIGNHGYKIVVLCKDGKPISKTIHRLVAETFIPNPNNLPIIDHIDRDKTNNVVSNLRWVNHSENGLNRPRRDLFGIHKKRNKYKVEISRKYYGSYDTMDEAKEVVKKVLNRD